MDSRTAVAALAALAQDTRLAIFRLLVGAGPAGLPAGEIASRLSVAPATLSFHLKELVQAGLLASRSAGRFVHYAPDFARMDALLAFLTAHCCSGSPCAPDPAGPARPSRRNTP